MSRLVTLIRPALLALIVAWIAAALFGAGYARVLHDEMMRTTPDAQQAEALYQARFNEQVTHGGLIPFVQIGLLCGVLAWQVGIVNRSTPRRDGAVNGALSGALVALVQAVLWSGIFQVLPVFLLPMLALILGTGIYAGWTAGVYLPDPQKPDRSGLVPTRDRIS